MQDQSNIIVIGCGNRFAGDDAVGLEIVERLRRFPDLGCELRAWEGGNPPGFLAEIPADSLVIFVDAVESLAPPGTIHCRRLPCASLQARHLASITTHGFSLPQEIELAKKLRGAVPRLYLIGVEMQDCHPGAPGMSEPVLNAVNRIVPEFPRYRQLAQKLA